MERIATEPDQQLPASATDERLVDLQARLLGWYRTNARDLPWRRTRDPYHILVSEVMLQQTQVDRVIPKYEDFLRHCPTIEALAAAETVDVIRVWSGLGYNRRAISLQRAAQAVVARHGGVMPEDLDALQALRGIGPYTAGAISCFAYEQDVGFVDTNIRRVLHRLFFGPELPEERATARELWELAGGIIPPGQGYEWNQAFMELGAVQCTARKPACLTCPLTAHCRAYPRIQSVLTDRRGGTRRKREEPFEGSNRYYRGRVVEALRRLRAGDTLDLHSLGSMVREDFSGEHVDWLTGIVDGLRQDGLAEIAEDAARCDAADPALIQVRLPRSRPAK
jgi:A/G-specific adenine glycosylase